MLVIVCYDVNTETGAGRRRLRADHAVNDHLLGRKPGVEKVEDLLPFDAAAFVEGLWGDGDA